jgi:uncharacterized membrane protein
MRKYLWLLGVTLLAAACSTPKYTYHFDHYDYNSGRKQKQQEITSSSVTTDSTEHQSPLALQTETMVASADEKVLVPAAPVAETKRVATKEEAAAILAKKYNSLSREGKKEFRQTVKKQMKAYAKAKREGDSVAAEQAVKALDNDLKLAIIFGAVGLTLTLFGGVNEAFWVLGVIAIVIGVVFLVKWVVRQ